MNWRRSFEETVEAHRDELLRQQRAHVDRMIDCPDGEVRHLSDMSWGDIDRKARRMSEIDLNQAINRHNERQA